LRRSQEQINKEPGKKEKEPRQKEKEPSAQKRNSEINPEQINKEPSKKEKEPGKKEKVSLPEIAWETNQQSPHLRMILLGSFNFCLGSCESSNQLRTNHQTVEAKPGRLMR